MTKTKIIIFYFIFSFFFLFNLKIPANADNEINISPIVQVISYSDIYGKYPQMMGWGSASIINKDGVIISNDHVVDNGKGALSSAFSLCVTKKISEKPVCDYTASLIARDDKLDISILKIDPKDIYGNPVDYSKFKTIDINYDYVPQNQDETIAIGYPWVGADTISETKGIVSGVTDYNSYKYIKTDTLIAGGNSGGAFVKDGKLIGIPTFGIGGGSDNSMGYALLISEAKNFIEKNIAKESNKSSITSLIDFNFYRKTIEGINNSLRLEDDVFDISILPDYQVTNYIKNNSFSIELKKQKDTGISFLYGYIEKTPALKNEKETFYYLQTKGFYSKDYQKLVKKNINGVDFYYPVYKNDLSNGDSNWGNYYFTIQNGYLVYIYLEAPFYDEKRNKDVKIEVEKALSGIKINTNNFSKIQTNFTTNTPNIQINAANTAIVDTGKYELYLGNLYEKLEVYLNELIEYNGKGKTAKEIYDVQLKDIDDSDKSMIKVNGLDGFLYCGDSNNYGSYFNYYNYYGGVSEKTDENGNPIALENCEINIFFPINKELNRHNYLSLSLTTLKNNKEKNLKIAIEFLKRLLKTPDYTGETQIPNILNNQVKLNFKDIDNQNSHYKNFLKILVKYKMIANTSKFDGDAPITWGEYLSLTSKYLYNFKIDILACKTNDYKCEFSNYKVSGKSLDSVFKELGITDYNSYIDSKKMENFLKILDYKLAGVDFGAYNWENFESFQNLIDEEKYTKEKEKINNFHNSIYGNRKILLSDFNSNYVTTFYSNYNLKYYPTEKRLISVKINSGKIDFSSKENEYDKEFSKLNKDYKCSLKKTFSEYSKCNKEYDLKYSELQQKYLENKNLIGLYDSYYFVPLRKASALENIFTQVDFGLFDQKLSDKKDTTIDLNNQDTLDEELEIPKDFQ